MGQGRAAVVGRLPRRPGQRRGEPHRHRDRLQGTGPHRGADEGCEIRFAAHRDADPLDHDGLRQGPEPGHEPGPVADGEVPGGAAQEQPRRRGQAHARGVGLPRVPGGEHQEGHPLHEPEGPRGTGHSRATRIGDRGLLRHRRQERRHEQGDGRRLHGDDRPAAGEEGAQAARRLRSRQRGHGLPGRRHRRRHEVGPLPASQEPVASAEKRLRGTRWLAAAVLLLACARALAAGAPLQVVTTTADLKSLTEAVGGDRVRVTALVPPAANAEDYQPRVSDLATLKSAGLVVRVGADYDLWLDRLLAQTGRRELQRGGAAHVDASFAVALLDVRSASLGQNGHAHGSGNPHYWLDPANAEIITGNIAEALIRLDPDNGRYYERRRLEFLQRLGDRQQAWQAKLAPWSGRPLVAYHNTWAYL